MNFIPRQYQEIAISQILDTDETGLFLDMGLGKTVISLTAVDTLMFESFEVSKVLVIAPLRVAADTWSRESEKWDHLNHLRIAKVLGSANVRRKALKEDADIYIINRENVVWLVDELGNNWNFDMVIIDELSSFKSSASKRFKALKRVRPFIDRIVGLTGTPAPNSLEDLWSQVYLLDQGERLGKTITAYRNKYFNSYLRGSYTEREAKEEAHDRVYELISDICMSMKAKDWLELPERIDNYIEVELCTASRKKYEQLERTLLLPFGDVDVVANTAATLSMKLLQLSNGAVYDEKGDVQHVHDDKLDALDEIVDTANGQSVLVFYSYKHDLARIMKRFPKAKKLETSEDIADWNAGKIPMLLAHPASAGHGLNLQDGGNIVVWFGLTWSLELYQQANARLHRQGQTNNVIIHHLIAKDTLDEDVMKALEGKAETQDALLDAVKARINKVAEEVCT